MTDWRSIPCNDVDWYAAGISRRASNFLRCETRRADGAWRNLTLGEVADIGVRKWSFSIQGPGFGSMAEQIVMTIIDMAAEGKKVAFGGKAPDAYIPKCERGTEGGTDRPPVGC